MQTHSSVRSNSCRHSSTAASMPCSLGGSRRLPPCRALLTADPLTLGDLALPFLNFTSDKKRSSSALVVSAPLPPATELGWRDGTQFAREYVTSSAAALGAGSFGKVRLAVHKSSGLEVAVKTMPKVRGRQTRDRTLEKIRRETSFMARLQASPYVVQLLDKFETEQEVHLVTELCRGGDLRQVVEGCGVLDERALASVAYQALQFIHSCHDNGLLYADMKPANLCLKEPHECGSDKPMQLKAIDFGTSQNCGPHHRLSKWSGTLTFLAPEVYAQDYSYKADLWSLGVSLYWCFCKRYPFWGGDGQPPPRARLEDMAEVVTQAPINYDFGPWLAASPECLDLMRRLLTRDESKRISVADALQHPWFAKWGMQL